MFCFLGLLGFELETPTANTGSTLLGPKMISATIRGSGGAGATCVELSKTMHEPGLVQEPLQSGPIRVARPERQGGVHQRKREVRRCGLIYEAKWENMYFKLCMFPRSFHERRSSSEAD